MGGRPREGCVLRVVLGYLESVEANRRLISRRRSCSELVVGSGVDSGEDIIVSANIGFVWLGRLG